MCKMYGYRYIMHSEAVMRSLLNESLFVLNNEKNTKAKCLHNVCLSIKE